MNWTTGRLARDFVGRFTRRQECFCRDRTTGKDAVFVSVTGGSGREVEAWSIIKTDMPLVQRDELLNYVTRLRSSAS